jgi:hypothetical protein
MKGWPIQGIVLFAVYSTKATAAAANLRTFLLV